MAWWMALLFYCKAPLGGRSQTLPHACLGLVASLSAAVLDGFFLYIQDIARPDAGSCKLSSC